MDQQEDRQELGNGRLEIVGRIAGVLVVGVAAGCFVEAYTGSPTMGGVATLLVGSHLWALLTLGDILDSLVLTKDAQLETLRRLDRGMTFEVRELKD